MDASSAGSGRHRFAVGALLGSGTFGDVYLARMTTGHGIEQEVAVKLLNPGIHPKSQPVARMRDEGRALAALNHPAILQVMDFCFLDGRIGLVTEYVQGSDLHDCIYGDHVIPARPAVHVVGLVADALHAAFHTTLASGKPMALVHRDIKPANMRVTPHGTVKLLDFGIAKSEDERRETATQHRVAIGTPSYMAPEALTYEVLEALPSRDVFALGCTLYEAVVHELYYEGLDHQEITRLSNKPDRFREWRSTRMPKLGGHDPRVVELISRMLRYNHEERPTARQVADTCLAVAEKGTGPALWAWCRQHPWPEPRRNNGPWSGRVIEDAMATGVIEPPKSGGAAAPAAAPGPTHTIAIPEATPTHATPATANPTIVVPDGARGTSYTVVRTQQADGTEIVILQEGKAESGASWWRLFRDAMYLLPLLVLLGGGALLYFDPTILRRLMQGDTSAITSAEFSKAMRSLSRKVSGDDTGETDPDAPKRGRKGRAAQDDGDDAGAVQLGRDAARVVVDGAWLVGVKPAGGSMIKIPRGGSTRIPPGEVEIFASLGKIVRYEAQFVTDVGPYGELRVSCDGLRCRED